ncbi:MAG: polysaccharide biosynthesis/export family protein [Deltaproteobacteria bacterium]
MKVPFSSFRFAPVLLLLAVTAGCKTTGDAIPVESLAPAATSAQVEYVLQAGDVIAIRVWNQDSITTRARIRPDGRISMPFLDDVEAAGATPNALAKRIQIRLKDFIVNPVVTVSLEEPRPLLVAVLGEVVKPGNYPLEASAGVLQALANAGGMTPFANKDAIVVIRRKADGSGVERIGFTYSGLTQVRGRAASFRLQPGDVVVVE